jgi:hypothetical protein
LSVYSLAVGLGISDWQAAGDGDRDGDLDLAVANFGSNSVAVLRNDGTGNFVSWSAVGGQIGVSALASGDFNGDGFLDLATADYGSDSVRVMIHA